jgi:outer membrane lipoprotein
MRSERPEIIYKMSMTLLVRAGALLSALSLLVMVDGCANPFPKDLLAKVEKNVTYQEFQNDPAQYDGRLMMFGGKIIKTNNVKNGAWIIVLQKPLDGEGRPDRFAESGGQFLIVTKSFLDLGAFHQGRSITVIGVVNGSMPQPISGAEYWYPLLEAQQLYLW